MWAVQQTSGGSTPCIVSNDPTQPEGGSSNRRTHGNKSSHEVNDPLATVDTDDRPCGASLPHESTGQSSKHVVALAPWLRRQVNDVDLLEHEESQTHHSSDRSKAHGDLWTHVSSDETQGTPMVVPDTCRPAMGNAGITATSRGSGVERMVQKEYHSVMSRDESLTPGPKVTFPPAGQPSAKGKERAAEEQPMSSAERRFDETWLERAMEQMERRLQATICSSLYPVSRSVNNLKVHVTAIKERVASREEDTQEDDSPLDSGQWRESPTEPRPAMGRESRANPLQGGPAPAKNYTGARSTRFEQMDVDPPENSDRQEPITAIDSCNVRAEDEDESVNDSWRM